MMTKDGVLDSCWFMSPLSHIQFGKRIDKATGIGIINV